VNRPKNEKERRNEAKINKTKEISCKIKTQIDDLLRKFVLIYQNTQCNMLEDYYSRSRDGESPLFVRLKYKLYCSKLIVRINYFKCLISKSYSTYLMKSTYVHTR
jgi:hypothetical protein